MFVRAFHPLPDESLLSGVIVRGPIVFCYARPEYPDEDYCEEVEEHFEHAAVYFAGRATTYVY